MRTIIAGNRGCTDAQQLRDAINACGFWPSVVLSGNARGADVLGEQWAAEHGVPLEKYPANWRPGGVFNKAAGVIRNQEMAHKADALIALWDGQSRGTKHMIGYARKRGLTVFVHLIKTCSNDDELRFDAPAP